MKTRKFLAVAILTLGLGFASFAQKTVMVGGAAMYPNKNIVENAVNSKDHTTLVAAVKAAGLVETLQSKGPFTVFAPTNAAFDQLPAGTVEGLMKEDKKEDLQNILQYHVTLSALNAESFHDGQTLSMVNGDNVTVNVKDGKVTLNNNVHIIASAKASNGMVHIVDGVLLPPQGKK